MRATLLEDLGKERYQGLKRKVKTVENEIEELRKLKLEGLIKTLTSSSIQRLGLIGRHKRRLDRRVRRDKKH